jgi:Xaa-Pro aminopeptidase
MPSTPSDELARRAAALQRHLTQEELDAALITQNADLFYFTGSVQAGVLVVPAEGAPVYGVRRVLERAREESALARVVALPSFRGLAALVKDAAGGPVRRVGLELDVLPVLVRDRFAAALPDAELIDVSASIRVVRSVKSPYELGKMRAAAVLAETMLNAALNDLREGMTELEFSGLVEAVARRGGHQGLVRVRGWNQEAYYGQLLTGPAGAVTSAPDTPLAGEGPNASVPFGAGHRRIRVGEPVLLDYTGVLDGYICDQTRTLVIGRLPAPLEAAHDAAVAILRAVEEAIRPGATPEGLYRVSLERAAALGYAQAFMGAGPLRARYVGHGVGLELDEWPVLAEGFVEPLTPGVVIAVEPKIVFPGTGAVGIEDLYAVTENGSERITRPEQRLFTVEVRR